MKKCDRGKIRSISSSLLIWAQAKVDSFLTLSFPVECKVFDYITPISSQLSKEKKRGEFKVSSNGKL